MYDLTYTEKLKQMIEYGTVAYYKAQFDDILADVQHDRPEYADNLIAAFKSSIAEWREYYAGQVQELDRISSQLDD